MTRPAAILLLAVFLGMLATSLATAKADSRRNKFPEGDLVEVHSSDSRAESQAGLNGPSGGPTSPSGRVRHSYKVDWRRRYLREHRHVQRLLAEKRQARRLQAHEDARAVICRVFGPYCQQAVAVASCETGGKFNTDATNGQYLGLFQMGSNERATYGHGPDARSQAEAAHRYFKARGYSWDRWTCQP